MHKDVSKNYLNRLSSEGISNLNDGKPKIALKKFETILLHYPNHPKILNLIGLAYYQLKNLNMALEYIMKAIANDSKEIGFYINLGNIYRESQNYSDAENAYMRGLEINNNSYELFYNLGILYTKQHKYKKAIKYYERSFKINPLNKFNLDNLGNAYNELARFDEAIKCYNKAIDLDQNFSQAKFNLSLVMLLTNPTSSGWWNYEYRSVKNNKIKKLNSFTKWDGSNLKNKNLLIHDEQGIGDTIQFARYIQLIKKDHTNIILYIKKNLEFLFHKISKIDEIITDIDNVQNVDFFISIMSLPYIFRHEAKKPCSYNFFHPNYDLKEIWRKKFNKIKKIKIGIMWQGNKLHRSDHKRSIPLKKMHPLFELNDIEFISLQKNEGRDQIKLNDYKNLMTDFFSDSSVDKIPFEDTLAIIDNLDLIICVDSHIGHIAATMEKETWIMLSYVPDFRWGLKSSTTTWYKDVRLFRQKKINLWESLILEIKNALIEKFFLKT